MSQSGWDVASDPERFEEAIAWFLSRVPMTKDRWLQLTEAQRRKAFTVAGVARADVLNDVFRAITTSLEKGTSLQDFQKAIGQKLREEWQGSVKNPAWRLEVIYRNNMQLALSAGRWKQMTDPAILPLRPYGMLDVILDNRVSEICEPLAGTVLPMEEFAKRGLVPPLHHACRTGIRSLRKRQAQREAKFGKPVPPIKAQEGWGLAPDQSEWEPDLKKYPPELRGEVEQHLERAKDIEPMPVPKGVELVEPEAPEVPQLPKPSAAVEWDGLSAADRKHIEAALKAADDTHPGKPAKVKVAVGDPSDYGGQAAASGIHAPLADSDGWGIVINSKSNAKELDFLHEFGHQIDKGGLKLTTKSGALSPDVRKNPAVKAFIAAIDNSAATKRISAIYAKVAGKSAEAAEHLEYLARRSEQFARAYAQYVATRSANKALLRQLEEMRKRRDSRGYLPMQWEDDDFEAIAKALEALLAKLGTPS